MKKLVLFAAIVAAVAFSACSKKAAEEVPATEPTEEVAPVVEETPATAEVDTTAAPAEEVPAAE